MGIQSSLGNPLLSFGRCKQPITPCLGKARDENLSLGAFQRWHAIEFGESDLHVGGTWGVTHGTNKTHLEFAFQALFLLFAKSVVQVWDRTWHLLREARPRFNIRWLTTLPSFSGFCSSEEHSVLSSSVVFYWVCIYVFVGCGSYYMCKP